MTGTARSRGGVPIYYEERGKGTPAIVFVHGWSCDRTFWREQIEHFGRAHRVVAIDLGGHGKSGHNRSDWTIEAYAEDVQRVVEQLSLQSAILVGHSMGGPVVVEAATRMAGHARGVVAVDFFQNVESSWSESRLAEALSAFRADFRATTEALVRSYFRPDTDSTLIERIVSHMASASPEIAIPSFESIRRYDSRISLGGLTCPMAIINSDFWPTDAGALRRCHPAIRISVLPNSDHFLMLGSPQAFNTALEETISEWTGGYP